MTDHLDRLSDTELNEVFAMRVAKWKPTELDHHWVRTWEQMCGDHYVSIIDAMPCYTRDLSLVMSWLDRVNYSARIDMCSGSIHGSHRIVIETWHTCKVLGTGYHRSFARAAMLALIRAERDKTHSLWGSERFVREYNAAASRQSGWKS